MDKKLELLARVPLFSGLDRAGLEQVGKLADQIDLPAPGRTSCRRARCRTSSS